MLRFSGEWPPQEYWSQYPNWENALDEEDQPGQDETTLRPAEDQSYITEDTVFTVGEGQLPSGQVVPALLEILVGTPSGVVLFMKEGEARIIEKVENESWAPFLESWLPPEKRHFLEVSINDPRIFPLRFVSRLPRKLGGKPWDYTIGLDGSLKRA